MINILSDDKEVRNSQQRVVAFQILLAAICHILVTHFFFPLSHAFSVSLSLSLSLHLYLPSSLSLSFPISLHFYLSPQPEPSDVACLVCAPFAIVDSVSQQCYRMKWTFQAEEFTI